MPNIFKVPRSAVTIRQDQKLPVTVEIRGKEDFENLSIQWFRNGKPIKGATSETYYLDDDDYINKETGRLKQISCQVSGDVEMESGIRSLSECMTIKVKPKRRKPAN